MIIEEHESPLAWCPMASVYGADKSRIENFVPDGYNTDKVLSSASFCLGSKCMAWRWVDDNSTLGYCGLAGEPASRKHTSPRRPTLGELDSTDLSSLRTFPVGPSQK